MVSIIVVNYNSTKNLKKLLKSLVFIDSITKEIIIVDNNSNFKNNNFESLKTNRKIILIKNKSNVGFAKAVNQGIKISKEKFILLLNPDTWLIDNSINKLYKEIKYDKTIGVIGGAIKDIFGKNKFSANAEPNFMTGLFEFTNLKKIFPDNKYSNNFWIEKKQKIESPIPVDSLCGAFLLFRKNIDNKIVTFDENYFLYLEDLDFCINNFRRRNYKIVFDPSSTIVHIGGSSSDNRYHTSLKHWYRSRIYFFNKNLNHTKGIILSILFTVEEKLLLAYHYIKHEPAE